MSEASAPEIPVQVRHVLVPTDFSDPAHRALRYGVALAQRFRARLTILHVLGFDPDAAISASVQPALAEVLEDRARTAMHDLDALAADIVDIDVEILLLRGTPSVEIVRTTTDEGCDLVVLGAHGRSALRHMLFGSTAERVVRKAPCPVLVVPSSPPL
jgi:nucleotide-binding universal stress UspA family protein